VIQIAETKQVNYSLFGGLPIIMIAIGGLNGWIVTGTLEGTIIGCLLGIVISVVAVFGVIPFLGIYIYHILANYIFDVVDMNLGILYWFGFAEACIVTVIIIIILIIILASRW
jgi:hypothetical protein